jgi:hypothetical protein
LKRTAEMRKVIVMNKPLEKQDRHVTVLLAMTIKIFRTRSFLSLRAVLRRGNLAFDYMFLSKGESCYDMERTHLGQSVIT